MGKKAGSDLFQITVLLESQATVLQLLSFLLLTLGLSSCHSPSLPPPLTASSQESCIHGPCRLKTSSRLYPTLPKAGIMYTRTCTCTHARTVSLTGLTSSKDAKTLLTYALLILHPKDTALTWNSRTTGPRPGSAFY